MQKKQPRLKYGFDEINLHKVQIVLKKLDSVDVLSYRKTVANYYCEGQMWEELANLLISAGYRKFAFWLERHSEYKICGANRQIAHVSPVDTDNENEYVTEILIPLEIR